MLNGARVATAALAEGRPILCEAVALIAKSPIPLLPFTIRRWIFV